MALERVSREHKTSAVVTICVLVNPVLSRSHSREVTPAKLQLAHKGTQVGYFDQDRR